ncbi:MAG: hypothetical protein JRC92_10990 [Deltaproteobacteria bacterium]|nr:hypothetical protein [Deltaproteobacteria bacterium]
MKKVSLLALASLLVALLLVPSLGLAEEPKYGGTLIFAAEADVAQMDPHRTVTMLEGEVFQCICNALVETDKNYGNVPALATSWEVSDDGLTWTFHLRQGVKFHNGREMTAEDVKWNYDRFMNPDVGSMLRTRYPMLDSTEVVDKYTIRFNLNRPSASFLATFGGSTVIAAILAPESIDAEGHITHPIGTGPFEFIEWRDNDYWRLKKFKDYWDEGLPYLDEIIMKPIEEEIMRHVALKTGDVDLAMMLPKDEVAKNMDNPPKGIIYSMDSMAGSSMIMFNVTKKPYTDKRVRQAIAYAINKKEIEMGVSYGYGEIMNQQFIERSGWNPGIPERKQDLAKAKALLAEAGYPDGFDDVMTVTNTYKVLIDAAQVIQAQLAEVGINLRLDIYDWAAWIAKATTCEYTIANCGLSQFSDPDLIYPSLFPEDSAFSWFMGKKYNNPEVNRLFEEAGTVMDHDKRVELYRQAMTLVNDDCPTIYYSADPMPCGWRDYVKGFVPHMANHYRYANGGLAYTWLDK